MRWGEGDIYSLATVVSKQIHTQSVALSDQGSLGAHWEVGKPDLGDQASGQKRAFPPSLLGLLEQSYYAGQSGAGRHR